MDLCFLCLGVRKIDGELIEPLSLPHLSTGLPLRRIRVTFDFIVLLCENMCHSFVRAI